MAIDGASPCPFCGSDDSCIDSSVDVSVHVHCNSCYCRGPFADYGDNGMSSVGKAVRLWNQRKPLVSTGTPSNSTIFQSIDEQDPAVGSLTRKLESAFDEPRYAGDGK